MEQAVVIEASFAVWLVLAVDITQQQGVKTKLKTNTLMSVEVMLIYIMQNPADLNNHTVTTSLRDQ